MLKLEVTTQILVMNNKPVTQSNLKLEGRVKQLSTELKQQQEQELEEVKRGIL